MPPKKVAKTAAKKNPRGMAKSIPPGLIMQDLMKKQWKLGPVIGQGGFGYIYLGAIASSHDVKAATAEYVIKIEPHANGPLFVEMSFYQRVAKAEMVTSWMKSQKKTHIGIPLYISTGSFEYEDTRYRFMVIDRFATDIEKLFVEAGSMFPEKTVYSLGLRIMDVLEYLHEREYVHADIKSSNLMTGFKKADSSKVYLLDYGLAYRYSPGGVHVPYKEDPKRKHDGTIEYTSRDAHRGCAPSRRGDLEILGYCMMHWLCGKLPWENKLTDKDYVFKQKEKYMKDVKQFMSECFPGGGYPDKLQEYLELINKTGYSDKPDYQKICKLFQAGLKQNGGIDDGKTVYLPTGKSSVKKASVVPSPKKPRIALKDLPPKNSPRKTAIKQSTNDTTSTSASTSAKKRAKSPEATPMKRVKANTARNSPRKPPDVSPVKRVQRTAELRRSPRNISLITSDESDDEREGSPLRKDKVAAVEKEDAKKVGNGYVDHTNGSCSDRIEVVDGIERTVHRRVRKKNVPTRDFAQSP